MAVKPIKSTEPRSVRPGRTAPGVKIPDPILAQPARKKMTFKKWVILIFVAGFLAGWFWMTWAMRLEPPIGLADYSFWQLLLPF